jgi:hypothetical protein
VTCDYIVTTKGQRTRFPAPTLRQAIRKANAICWAHAIASIAEMDDFGFGTLSTWRRHCIEYVYRLDPTNWRRAVEAHRDRTQALLNKDTP